MGKRSIGLLLLVLLFFFVGCEDANKTYTNEIKDGWLDVDNNWIDSEDSYLGYVPVSNYLDLSWYPDFPDKTIEIRGYIHEYTYTKGKLIGTYTTDSDLIEYDITITFSYAASTLTAVIVAEGVLGTKR